MKRGVKKIINGQSFDDRDVCLLPGLCEYALNGTNVYHFTTTSAIGYALNSKCQRIYTLSGKRFGETIQIK